jgi:hypothetical protein
MTAWFYSHEHKRHFNLSQVVQVKEMEEGRLRVVLACTDAFTLSGDEADKLRHEMDQSGWHRMAAEHVLDCLDAMFSVLRKRNTELEEGDW